MFKINAPEKNYKGVTSGIAFSNGTATAELDAFTKDWFLSKGYTLEEIKSTPVANNGAPVTDPEAGKNTGDQEKPITKAELVKKAKELGIEVKSKATNAELEKLIADKEAEIAAAALKAQEELKNSGTEDPEAGAPVTDPEAGAQGNGDSEKGE